MVLLYLEEQIIEVEEFRLLYEEYTTSSWYHIIFELQIKI